ncbi:DUF1947 domain-containing protein [Candidatus Woesearchaeota archaeon]|nr:DUF1947 domain-containing protein [Candidatus Woesearchaeota archaeon]
MKHLTISPKDFAKEVQQYGYKIEITKKDLVEVIEKDVEDKNSKIVLINKQPVFFYYQQKLIPTLKYLQTNQLLKSITIDMGAIKFIVNGADIMRPGIVEIEEGINKEDLVVIIDKNNKKPLAVGIALFNSNEMETITSGKAIKNIHYVGDELWKFELK